MITIPSMRDNKPGMEFINQNYINKIIKENTSRKFTIHEQQRAKRIEQQIERNLQLLAKITEEQIKQAKKELDEVIIPLMEKQCTLNRFKVHIDMDAFFASVECRDNPMLRSVPMAVGSDSMLATSNYLARKYGVRSAMPGFIAKKLCPDIIIVPGNYAKYSRESQTIREIFERFDPNYSMGSLDEAYLDLTDAVSHRTSNDIVKRVRYTGQCICKLPLLSSDEQLTINIEKVSEKCDKCGKERISVIDSVEFGICVNEIVRQIRFEVEQATGLTCSAGIAANEILAKIGSNINKPNGQFYLESNRDRIIEFMRLLPIRKVPGIGQVSEAILKALNINTCGDLHEKRGIIKLIFSKHYSQWLLGISLGLFVGRHDAESANEDSNQKSISIERTFSSTRDLKELLSIIRKLSEKLIDSLQASSIIGGYAATLKIKFNTFDVITRCKTVNFVIRTVDTFFSLMENILKKEFKERNNNLMIRLLGVRLSNLVFYDNDNYQGCSTEKGIQQSLLQFVRPVKYLPSSKLGKNFNSILIELNSDDDVIDREFDEIIPVENKIKDEQILAECSDGVKNELAQEYIEEDDGIIFVEKIVQNKNFVTVHNSELTTGIKRTGNSKKIGKRKKSMKINESVNEKQQRISKKRKNNLKDLHNYFPIIL